MESFLQLFGNGFMSKVRVYFMGLAQDNTASFLDHFPIFHPKKDLDKYLTKIEQMTEEEFDDLVARGPYLCGRLAEQKGDRGELRHCVETYTAYAKKDRKEFVDLLRTTVAFAFAKEGDALRRCCMGGSDEDMEDPTRLPLLNIDERQAHVNRYINSFCRGPFVVDEKNFQQVCYLAHSMLTGTLVQSHDDPQSIHSLAGKMTHSHPNSVMHREPPPSDKPCARCGKPNATKKCARCKQEFYCNRDCQKVHWKAHKKACQTMR